jgi:hypothetical protein
VPVPAGLHRSFRPSWRSMRPAALSSLIWPAAVAMLASREHNFVCGSRGKKSRDWSPN